MKDILRWVTHGPTPKEMMDLYSSFDWTALCGEVAKLKLERREGKLFAMPIRAVANGDGRDQSTSASILGAVLVQSWCSPWKRLELRRKKSDPDGTSCNRDHERSIGTSGAVGVAARMNGKGAWRSTLSGQTLPLAGHSAK